MFRVPPLDHLSSDLFQSLGSDSCIAHGSYHTLDYIKAGAGFERRAFATAVQASMISTAVVMTNAGLLAVFIHNKKNNNLMLGTARVSTLR